ncbi:hypothetical protein C21_04621 [Arenibacter sp. NBRC 103722]|uniref:hypothetical protein n=1 Tax=Arenibacter sp. NBRC 103722 TaxID=1113929 RepID=UPI000852D6DB|nr:hypothetical protein [Arenibacter sp. NBRC 103722]GBF22426.1 hypothetical protein C21_04621 [Arenibacter sp. NBRC 103722]
MAHFPEIVALLVSVSALIITYRNRVDNKRQTKKSNEKAERAIKLSEGTVEMGLRNSISNARTNVNSAIRDLENFRLQNPKAELKVMTKLFWSAVEDLLNQYERACMLYLDNKLDKDRFKIEYSFEIRNIIEKGEYKDKYFPAHTSKYKAILKVYDEWENLEK